MAWRTAETCVAKYNWWWVYYQNIVTYLPKCVLEDPCMIVVLYCVNSLVQPTATGGLCGVRLTLYGLVISTAVGSSPAHGRRGWCRCVWLMVIYYCAIVRRSGVHAVFPCGSCNVLHSSEIGGNGRWDECWQKNYLSPGSHRPADLYRLSSKVVFVSASPVGDTSGKGRFAVDQSWLQLTMTDSNLPRLAKLPQFELCMYIFTIYTCITIISTIRCNA